MVEGATHIDAPTRRRRFPSRLLRGSLGSTTMDADERQTMEVQADTMADEAVFISATPSYFVVEWRHIRKRYSLVTGIPHIEEMA